ncbi:hypothetical protein ACO0K9_11935 [Undibacterium sp. Ji50W]|uniref:hypothetical protein n=1 Tax=Undibacterium sp. Ji50W TaxID=3413041 RepID=UPI003BEF884F
MNSLVRLSTCIAFFSLLVGCARPVNFLIENVELPLRTSQDSRFLVSGDRSVITKSNEYDWVVGVIAATVAGSASGSAQFGMNFAGMGNEPNPIAKDSRYKNLADANIVKSYEKLGDELFGKPFEKFELGVKNYVQFSPHVNLYSEDNNVVVQCDLQVTHFENGSKLYSRIYRNRRAAILKDANKNPMSFDDFQQASTDCLRGISIAYKRHYSGEFLEAAKSGKFIKALMTYSNSGRWLTFFYPDDIQDAYFTFWSEGLIELYPKKLILSFKTE